MNVSSTNDKILQFFTSHPLLGFIGCLGSLASIIALPFALFPSLTSARKDFSFYVNPVRTPIVQIAKPSDVSVSYKGSPVNGNVTAVQIAIWNAGKEPIRIDDFLEPIILHTATNQIMEASILKTTREVCAFEVDRNHNTSNSIGMKWRILEKGDGALLQLVYVGDLNVPFTVDGILVGQPHSHQVERNGAEDRWAELIKIICTCTVGSLISAIITVKLTKGVESRKVRGLGLQLILCLIIAFMLLAPFMYWDSWIHRRPLTPFGF